MVNIKSTLGGVWNSLGFNQQPLGSGQAVDKTKGIYKAVIPKFLYKPPYGYPRFTDIPELRRLAATPYVDMAISTIIDEIASIDWDIKLKDGKDASYSEIDKVREFFYNPNTNNESFEQLLRKILRDILTIDSGVLLKIYDGFGNFKEIYQYDGGTFTKNPDIHGTMNDRWDIIPAEWTYKLDTATDQEGKYKDSKTDEFMRNKPAYYQYGWITGARPTPFGKKEVMYFTRNPQPDSIYGRSPMEYVLDMVQTLVYGVDHNLEYYTENNVPKGFIQMLGATQDDINRFQQKWAGITKKKDSVGNWRQNWHKVPIIGSEAEFKRLQFTNAELELISQQQWLSKLVWASFGVTPSELGFTEDSNKASEVVQSKVFKRKAIKPLLNLLEYKINTELVWSEFNENLEFKFDQYDVDEDIKKHQLYQMQLNMGLKTPNEIREEIGLDAKEDGDKLKTANPLNFNLMNKEDDPYKKKEDLDKEDEKVDKEEKSIETKPFGEYEDFAECVRRNKDKKDPEAYCAALHKKITGKYPSEKNKKKECKAYTPLTQGEPDDVIFKLMANLLKEKQKFIIDSIKQYYPGKDVIGELKALDKKTIQTIANILSLGNIENDVRKILRDHFYDIMDKEGTKFNMNFMPNQNVIDFLETYTIDNIKDLTEEMRNDIRAELERGIIDGEGTKKLTNRINEVFDKGKTRAEMIARTETNRIENQAKLESYKQTNIKGKKQWVSAIDNKTSTICKRLDGQKQPLGKPFKDKEFEGMSPPAHVNCRSSIVFVPDE